MFRDGGRIELDVMRGRGSASGGFTLVEMMIVVAVIAILAAVVLPSYQDSVRKSRRVEAKGALTSCAQRMERYNTEKNTYVGASFGTAATDTCRPTSESGYYTLASSNLAVNTFTITATPVVGSDQAKDSCGSYTLDQAGTKGPVATAAKCW